MYQRFGTIIIEEDAAVRTHARFTILPLIATRTDWAWITFIPTIKRIFLATAFSSKSYSDGAYWRQ